MKTTLAIYDALLQAGVAEAPARRVAESLEQDLTLLATKQDLLMVRQDVELVRQDVVMVRQDLQHLDERLTLRMETLESRVVIRLSLVMAGLFSVAGTIIALLR